MARRTKAEIRADKIAELARKRRELDELMKAEQREAAKEAKAAFVASQAALGKAVADLVGASSAEAVDAALEALVADGALDRVREAVGGVPAGKANTLTFSVEAVRALIGDFLAREGAGLAELDAVVPCDSYSVACLMCEHCSLRDTRTDLLVAAMDGE